MVIADLALSDIAGVSMSREYSLLSTAISSSSSFFDVSCKCAHADLTRSRLAIDGGKEEDFNSSAALILFLSCLEPRAAHVQINHFKRDF